MRTTTILKLAAATAAFVGASAAQAAVIVCQTPSCIPDGDNVLVEAATDQTTINGSINSGGTDFAVEFTSPDGELLDGSANGQATVSASDDLLNSLTFALTGGATFASATFNLNPISGNGTGEATSVTISYTDPFGVAGTFTIDTNGQNFFGIYGTAGEMFTSVTVNFAGDTGINDLRQLRLGGLQIAAVPEPGTWAMMLLGFGAAGVAMRRRKRSTGRALQIA